MSNEKVKQKIEQAVDDVLEGLKKDLDIEDTYSFEAAREKLLAIFKEHI